MPRSRPPRKDFMPPGLPSRVLIPGMLGLSRVAATIALAALAGCATADGGGRHGLSSTSQHGYVVPPIALEQIPPGSSKDQVLIALGSPSTTANYGNDVYYYISQTRRRAAAFMRGQSHRSEDCRRLLRRQGPGRAGRQLRPEGRQGLRLRQERNPDRRRRPEFRPAGIVGRRWSGPETLGAARPLRPRAKARRAATATRCW